MPYIKKQDRLVYDTEIDSLVSRLVEVFHDEPTRVAGERAGHLNYIITTLLLRFYKKLTKRFGLKIRYADYNEIIGVLECLKLEMYRRQVATYEDEKIKSEGDVG
jgi:hypothetical protein